MSVFPKPAELFGTHYGFLVTGGAKTLPATATGHIFTVAGGRVLITSLTGIVTTAIQNQACTLSIGNTPTGGTAGATTLATAVSIANAAIGVNVSMPPLSALGVGQALIVGAAGIAVPMDVGGLAIVPAGTIDVATSATNTGAITYSVTYVSYDAGATITAL
jgi:hypothetical protein